jgi:hypothetical protein
MHRWRPFVSISSLALLLFGTPLQAQDAPAPPITIGAGMRTSFVHTEFDDLAPDDATDAFLLDSVRLYVSGPVTNHVSFMFNTEYQGSSNDIGVLDAVVRLEFSDAFNIWAGRFLPPSDRANLYGPYYAHHWAIYTDGIQDGYPFIFQGRDNGVAYWGQFGKVKVSGGAFDGASLTGDDTALVAGRVQVDFWDPEPGYYLNGTYYGDKNLLALGVAGQAQGGDRSAYNVDVLLERMVSGGAVSFEAQWNHYDQLGGYDSQYRTSDGGYALAAYLFPGSGPGRWEVLGKYAHARFRDGIGLVDVDYDQKTTELNLNYVIEQFNARLMMFVKDTRFDAVRVDSVQVGVGMQVQM